MGYINQAGQYYEGDLQYGDLEVPNRPSSEHTWDGIQWNAPLLSERQEARWELIKQKRSSVQDGGVLVGTKWYHSDSDSRIQQLGLVLMGASIPANLQWKTLDGSFVLMTQTLAGQIFNAVATHDTLAFSNAETHRAAMMLSLTPETYDFSTGWPANYS